MSNLQAISIRQPWAWLIVHAGKDVENRSWNTRVRGPVLIHASKGCTKEEYEDAVDFARTLNPELEIPPLSHIERGGIVGKAVLSDCVNNSDSPWFFGPYGFVFTGVEPLEFIPCRGSLGFFNPESI